MEMVLATPTHQINDMDAISYDFDNNKPWDLEKGLVSLCGGLAEVSISTLCEDPEAHRDEQIRNGDIQLLHQTGRDFLLDRRKFANPFHLDENGGDQEIILTCCRYLKISFIAPVFQQEADASWHQLKQVTQRLGRLGRNGLLLYCTQSLANHIRHLKEKDGQLPEELKMFTDMLKSQPGCYASLLLSRWVNSLSPEISILINPNTASDIDTLQSVLVLATGIGEFLAVVILINLGAKVNGMSGTSTLASINAVKHEQSLGVEALLPRDSDNDLLGSTNYSALHIAAAQGYVEIANFLLRQGANVDIINLNGDSPLHIAAGNGHDKFVELLLQCGARDEALENGPTPLMSATENGHDAKVALLCSDEVEYVMV